MMSRTGTFCIFLKVEQQQPGSLDPLAHYHPSSADLERNSYWECNIKSVDADLQPPRK